MSIKLEVEQLLESYRKELNALNMEREKWRKDTMYSNFTKDDEIAKVQEKINMLDAKYNGAYSEIFQNEASDIRGNKINTADFQLSLLNALAFLNMSGNGLTDESAFEIVRPFFGDYQTVHRLAKVLENKENIMVTLIALNSYDFLIRKLDKIGREIIFNSELEFEMTLIEPIILQSVEKYELLAARLNALLQNPEENIAKIIIDFKTSDMTDVPEIALMSSAFITELNS